MATISIYDLQSSGFELFFDSESYLNDLVANELGTINGGLGGSVIPTQPSDPEIMSWIV
ncbi:MAG: hypothetical protein MUD14_00265 [Hydrococcus sp. Prado102]|jgi:hypothetical protein|nr:hypothetical protein [Hydrococcus sp. Prado102]